MKPQRAGHPPSLETADDWSDIEYAEDWIDLGYGADEAQAWDMDPIFADAWAGVGASPSEAHVLHDAGLGTR